MTAVISITGFVLFSLFAFALLRRIVRSYLYLGNTFKVLSACRHALLACILRLQCHFYMFFFALTLALAVFSWIPIARFNHVTLVPATCLGIQFSILLSNLKFRCQISSCKQYLSTESSRHRESREFNAWRLGWSSRWIRCLQGRPTVIAGFYSARPVQSFLIFAALKLKFAVLTYSAFMLGNSYSCR